MGAADDALKRAQTYCCSYKAVTLRRSSSTQQTAVAKMAL